MWSNHVSDHMPKDMSWFEFLNMATDCSHDDCLFILSSTAKAKASLSISFIILAEYFYRSISMDCFIPMQNKIGDVMLLYRWEKLRDDLVDYHSHSGQMMDSQPADSNPHPPPLPCDAFYPRFVHYLGCRKSHSGDWLQEAGSFLT